ncbi:PREDICTED: uncharacterized protein LOC107356814 [Acropora digitifera]|uniref:uncharacterized protein LOC107356814 n=1 Tax=Acropora digitifera TaxID=70779 RepID=UPI00077A49E8|nr:PREDICTED: uncharacterized protein LOC107356814 [Acropora digitifera]
MQNDLPYANQLPFSFVRKWKTRGKGNKITETPMEEVTSEEKATPCECLEETVVDTEECDKKRRRMLEKYQRENEGKRQLTDNGHGVDDDGESNDSGTIGPRAQMLIMIRIFNQTACLQLNLQISYSIWFWRRASSRNNNLRLSEA